MLILLLSFIAAGCCVGLALTQKVRTTSLEILALLAVFIGAVINLQPILISGIPGDSGVHIMIMGSTSYVVLVLLRATLSEWLDKLYYDATPQHPQRRITDRRK